MKPVLWERPSSQKLKRSRSYARTFAKLCDAILIMLKAALNVLNEVASYLKRERDAFLLELFGS